MTTVEHEVPVREIPAFSRGPVLAVAAAVAVVGGMALHRRDG